MKIERLNLPVMLTEIPESSQVIMLRDKINELIDAWNNYGKVEIIGDGELKLKRTGKSEKSLYGCCYQSSGVGACPIHGDRMLKVFAIPPTSKFQECSHDWRPIIIGTERCKKCDAMRWAGNFEWAEPQDEVGEVELMQLVTEWVMLHYSNTGGTDNNYRKIAQELLKNYHITKKR